MAITCRSLITLRPPARLRIGDGRERDEAGLGPPRRRVSCARQARSLAERARGLARISASDGPTAPLAIRLKRGCAAAIAGAWRTPAWYPPRALGEELLDDAVLERMEGHDHEPAAGLQHAFGRMQRPDQFAEFVIRPRCAAPGTPASPDGPRPAQPRTMLATRSASCFVVVSGALRLASITARATRTRAALPRRNGRRCWRAALPRPGLTMSAALCPASLMRMSSGPSKRKREAALSLDQAAWTRRRYRARRRRAAPCRGARPPRRVGRRQPATSFSRPAIAATRSAPPAMAVGSRSSPSSVASGAALRIARE